MITEECFKGLSTDEQWYEILLAVSAITGYIPPSKACFLEMSEDYQLYYVWAAWSGIT